MQFMERGLGKERYSRHWLARVAAMVAITSGLAACQTSQKQEARAVASISKPVPTITYEPTTSTTVRSTTTSSAPETTTTLTPPKTTLPEQPLYGGDPRIAGWLTKLPSLVSLAKEFPLDSHGNTRFPNVNQQLAYIQWLNQNIDVSVTDYEQLHINTSYENAFDNQPGYYQTIKPTMFVDHWTAEHYANGVVGLISELQSFGERVEFYIDRNGQIYQLFNNDYRYPAHARGANGFSQGVEIEATGTLDYTPLQLERAIDLDVLFARRNHLAVNASTILGHQTVDLLFDNATYSRDTGQFHPFGNMQPYVGKIDPPQELMSVLVEKAVILDNELGE